MNAVTPIAGDSSPDRLPATYEAARAAIEACERLDECKAWQDKAAAMAAYARMRDDDGLRVMAVRIQDRAARRFGILFQELHPRTDKDTRFGIVTPHNPVADGNVSPHKPVSRVEAARQAGTSPHQLTTALRVASLPEQEFERQVESPDPPTVRQLAEQGRTRRVPDPDPTAECFKAACNALLQFTAFCDSHDPAETARTFGADDLEMARRCVATLDQWLDAFVTRLGAE